ncbi:MAG: DsbA family protein, partial [Gammaproteobacteria bacterium]
KQLSVRLVLAPFRIDSSAPMTQSLREYVLQQWHNVHHTTGQAFNFSFEMGPDFIYDTKLACRAIKAFSKQQSEQELEFMHAIQVAFYCSNLDITNEKVLVELLANYEIDTSLFIKDLYAKEISRSLEEDFNYCQQLEVQGYPTLVGIKEKSIIVLAYGYAPYAELKSKIESWIEG